MWYTVRRSINISTLPTRRITNLSRDTFDWKAVDLTFKKSPLLLFFTMQVVQIFFALWLVSFSEFSCKNDHLLAVYDGTYWPQREKANPPESFRKVDVNNPFFPLSLSLLLSCCAVSETSLDVGLYSNNNLCNYVYVWVHGCAQLRFVSARLCV